MDFQNEFSEEWREPALTLITQVDDAPTDEAIPSPRFYRAGGTTVTIYKRTQWTAPQGGAGVIARCDTAVARLFDAENPVPESAVAELETIVMEERKGDAPYVRAEINLITGYVKLHRFEEAFQAAQWLAFEEPTLQILRDERADIYMSLGISALRFYQNGGSIHPDCAPDVTLLKIARQSYAKANIFCEGNRLGLLCWWARVEIECGDTGEAERLWWQARSLLTSRPELASDMQSILNKDEALAALNACFENNRK